MKVILLGSSRLLLQEGLTESMAGRFEIVSMSHWKYREMKDAFGTQPDEFVYFGGYPGAVHLAGEEDRWKSYIRDSMIETTISRDVLLMTGINKPSLLKAVSDLEQVLPGRSFRSTRSWASFRMQGIRSPWPTIWVFSIWRD